MRSSEDIYLARSHKHQEGCSRQIQLRIRLLRTLYKKFGQWMIRNIFRIRGLEHLKGEALFAWLLAGAAAADPATAARRAI